MKTRDLIVELVKDTPKKVAEIAEALGHSKGATNITLRKMVDDNWLERERSYNYFVYGWPKPKEVRKPVLQGFASLSKDGIRENASRAGKRAHELGVAHKFTSEEAKVAGKKGGSAPRKNKG